MAMPGRSVIGFARVKDYLNAIADAHGGISTSPHRRFWNLSYQAFVDGDVPNVTTHVPPAHPWVLFGVRLCDAKGLMLLDLLFADREADPYYVRRRESCTVVALRCDEPTVECFCETAGSVLSAPEGADVVLTPLEGRFLVESFSPKGEALVAGAGALLAEAHAADLEAKGETVRQAAAAQRRQVNLEGIRDAIAARFDDQDLWRRFSRACVGCGICTFLCPTCSCFDVLDDAAGANGKRYRCWDSCQFDQFCLEASGHDPRPERWVRQRNRVAHKLYYSVDRFGRVTCVGCGRCIRHCPVNVDITEAVRAAAAPAPENTE
jgi:ferredoxin